MDKGSEKKLTFHCVISSDVKQGENSEFSNNKRAIIVDVHIPKRALFLDIRKLKEQLMYITL